MRETKYTRELASVLQNISARSEGRIERLDVKEDVANKMNHGIVIRFSWWMNGRFFPVTIRDEDPKLVSEVRTRLMEEAATITEITITNSDIDVSFAGPFSWAGTPDAPPMEPDTYVLAGIDNSIEFIKGELRRVESQKPELITVLFNLTQFKIIMEKRQL